MPRREFGMDRPRFQRVEGARDELHRRYHGGGVVEAVFCLVDAFYLRRLQFRSRSLVPNGKFLKLPFAGEPTTLHAKRDGPA
jgi:hypothetical protein